MKSFLQRCSAAMKMIPDIHCSILNKLLMSFEINPSEVRPITCTIMLTSGGFYSHTSDYFVITGDTFLKWWIVDCKMKPFSECVMKSEWIFRGKMKVL